MNTRLSMAFTCVLALLASTAGAAACQGQNALYSDDFATADPAWGEYDTQKIEEGVLRLLPDANGGLAIENQTGFFEDFDVCVDLVQKNEDPTTGYAGILFWGIDYDNFYTMDVATNGYIRVSRKQNQRWLTPVSWTPTENIVKPGAEVNQVRVVAKGAEATLFVNGKEVRSFKGQPPKGGGLIGVYAASPKESKGIYDFDNFNVTAVE